jgi:hypothetical protein
MQGVRMVGLLLEYSSIDSLCLIQAPEAVVFDRMLKFRWNRQAFRQRNGRLRRGFAKATVFVLPSATASARVIAANLLHWQSF